MLESIKRIGESISSFEDETSKVKGKGTLLVKIIFDLDAGLLDCDYLECRSKKGNKISERREKLKEYLWKGNDVGNKPQRRLTTDNPEYILNPDRRNKWVIEQIVAEIDRRGYTDADVLHIRDLLKRIRAQFFPDNQNLMLAFEKILSEKGIKKSEVALYTVSVKESGRIIDLVKEPGYQRFLNDILYETESDEWPMVEGRCHVCGEKKKVLSNPSYPEGSFLIVYNVDKIGFMPELNREPSRVASAHAVCPDCKKKLRLGWNFIDNNLSVMVGGPSLGLNAYLIPSLVGPGPIAPLLQKLAQEMKEAFGLVNSYKKLEDAENVIKEYSEVRKRKETPVLTYSLNVLFGRRESSHFAFCALIENVPVTRLIEVAEKATTISKEASELIIGDWNLSFEKIFSIFPIRTSRTGPDWRPAVELLSAILNGTSYPKEEIVSRSVLFAKICRYGAEQGYNVSTRNENPEVLLCEGIFKYNLLIRLLSEIGVIGMSPAGSSDVHTPDEKIEGFFSQQGYTEWQRSLFLLGYLVGKIGIAQYKKGDEKKSVLNKVNFEGMHAEKVKYLANYVLEGLRDYRILDAINEQIYAYMKEMMDRNLDKMQNPIDNTFYLLSGYAYSTLQAIKSGGEKNERT
ncbi:MAG: type I-B CRISPR-associated protein Cas8b/Csh1 [Candidatus Methanomethylicia archaeon]|jgi:CRISPR-associated protein Csh1|nr:type I-B CRISPR-associated protein Cas8b/Csh1 [Candidatus Methanomethylicia archaeon]